MQVPVKRPVFYILILVLLQLLIVSCNGYDQRLERADAVMETDPAEALKQLSAIDSKQLSEKDNAYYALLLSQAQIKNYEVPASDSLIQIARDYYSKDDGSNYKMRACFYEAYILFFKNDFQASMHDAVIAYDIAKTEHDNYWIAKTAELIADIFNRSYNTEQSKQFRREAIDYYKSADKTSNHRFALCDLALEYINESSFTEAIALLDSLEEIVLNEKPIDDVLLEYMTETRSIALMNSENIEELQNTYQSLDDIEITSAEEFVDLKNIEGKLFSASGQYDSADSILTQAANRAETSGQLIRVLYSKYLNYLRQGNYERAALLADTLLDMHESNVSNVLLQSAASEQRDYYSQKALIEKAKKKRTVMILTYTIVAAIMICILITIILRLKQKKRRYQLESKLSSLLLENEQLERSNAEKTAQLNSLNQQANSVAHLKSELYAAKIENLSIANMIEVLFKEKWVILNTLCRQYFEFGNSDKSKKIILTSIEKELDELKNEEGLKVIESEVNKYMNGIMTMIRHECPMLKDKELSFLTMVYAGMSPRTVCVLQDIKYEQFYVRKSRLKSKILKSGAEHSNLFIEKMK